MKIYILIILIFVTASCIAGQETENGRSIYDPPRGEPHAPESLFKLMGRDKNGMIEQPKPSPLPKRNITIEQQADIRRTRDLVTPHPEDVKKSQSFLKQPRTGIFRLFPEYKCESKYVVKIGSDCLNAVPGTSVFSFRRKDYADQRYFDIQLKDGDLISRSFLAQGILTTLGDVPIENISLTSNGIKFLTDFKPEKEIQLVRNQYKQISKGVNTDNYLYTNSVKAEANMTYALRVVAYRRSSKEKNEFVVNDERFTFIDSDKRRDITIVFRVVRKTDDGKLTIVWKELKNSDSPIMMYPKDDKFSDLKFEK